MASLTPTALAISAGCANVPSVFPSTGSTLAAGASQAISTFAVGEVLTFTQISGPSGTLVTQGNNATIAGPFSSGSGTYIATPITSVGADSITIKNNGIGSVVLSAVCHAPTTFTVSVLTDPATGTASNCSAGSSTCSLRDAIAAANALSGAAATIVFAPGVVGTLKLLNGPVNIGLQTVVNIVGPGANFLTLSGNNTSGIFFADYGSHTTVNDLTFTAGKAASGGAILTNSDLTVSGCAFIANQATGRGGAIDVESSKLTVISSTFSGNATPGYGGAILVSDGPSATINNSTFTANSGGNGGALAFTNMPFSLTNDTIAANTAVTSGGGVFAAASTLNLGNTAIAGNSATGSYPDLFNSGTTNDNGGNIFTATATGGPSTVNPELLPLVNYGGPLKTMLPQPLSPLLCHGDAALATAAGLTLDERNDPRTTTYGSATCVDTGAVQTNYSLRFVQQPANTIGGVVLAPSPSVQWRESGITFPLEGQAIQIAATAGSLNGVTTQHTDASGLATFPGLSINSAQTGETLKASLPLSSLPAVNTSVISSAFNVTTPLTTFVITALPSTATAGSAIGFTLTAMNSGAPATAYTGTVILSSAQDAQLAFVGGGVMYTFTSADAGTHTFTAANGIVFKTAGSDTLTVTDIAYNVAANGPSVTVHAAAPALLSAVSGSGQTAPIGGTFLLPLRTKVTDIYGNPNNAVAVSFAGPSSGAGIAPTSSTATTGNDGIASLTAIANSTTSAYSVTASVAGIATPVSFALTNTQASSHIAIAQVAPLPVTSGTGVNVPTTFVATLSDATQNSAGLPTGSVQFYVAGLPIGAPVTLANAQATLTTTFATAGSVNITAQYLGDNNFTTSTSSTLVEVVLTPGYTITVNPASLTIHRGDTATATLTITPTGNYQGTISYACDGMPQFSSCQFLPSTVTLVGDNTPKSVSLTVFTLGPSNSASLDLEKGNTSAAGLWWIPGIALAGLLALHRRRLSRITGLLTLILLAGSMLALGGCVTQHYYTALGDNTATISAVGTAMPGSGSANQNQSATFAITIQP